MKFATHVLAFNQDRWMLKNIANAYPHVDRIYVSYSKVPWLYNRKAREQFTNTFDLDTIRNSPYMDKITIIEGEWDRDEDQRNACRIQAEKDGMDYLIKHDADEFYMHADFKRMLTDIEKDPDYDYYSVPWISFWKTLDYVIVNRAGETVVGYPRTVINLRKNLKYVRCARSNGASGKQLDALCHHASYVLSDDELWEKINTWGHAHQVKKTWFKETWQKWTIGSQNLHPVSPADWKCAIKFTGKLPEVLLDETID